MSPNDAFAVGRVLFVLGALIYFFAVFLIANRVKDKSFCLVLLGIVTVVIGAWFGGLPDAPASVSLREPGVTVSATLAESGAPIVSRVGVLLVLAGLLGFFLRPDDETQPPKNSGGAS